MYKYLLSVIAIAVFFTQVTLGASMYLEPKSGTFPANCPIDIDIMIATEQETTVASASLFAYIDIYEINDVMTSDGMFPVYLPATLEDARHPSVKGNTTLNIIGTTAAADGFVGTGKFATLTITPYDGISRANLAFYMIPNEDRRDSTIAYYDTTIEQSIDVLDTAIDGQYNFDDSLPCDRPNLPPMKFAQDIGSGNNIQINENPDIDTDIITEDGIQEDTRQNIKKVLMTYRYYIGGLIILLIILLIIFKRKKKS